mgnify:CR=1 FL=1
MRPDDPTDLPPDDDAVPAPDAPADASERARAKAFAELIDKVVAGRPPAAVPSEQQELLEAEAFALLLIGFEQEPHGRPADRLASAAHEKVNDDGERDARQAGDQ